MAELDVPARVIDDGSFETVHYPDDEIRLRAAETGAVEVTEPLRLRLR